MKFSVVLALAMAGLTITASGQKLQKPKTKPSHSAEKESSKKSSHAVKEPVSKTNAATELRHVEQSSAKLSASKRVQSNKTTHNDPTFRVKTKDSNPPIHLGASGSSGKGGKGKSGDPLKGRLRHKGSHH